ncbi:nuclear transport factor 2 family protein [Jiulongibacter sediminis]|jgi:ketosteroid isomerase-like protein|uniref:nuclear transport factor 2 family protein n=1 Tax=Jiulongibacter sediminis TaxID=1605367 RepID=UPI0026F2CE36|nr:nuclear transport factor 2 family protein [Jiulongibacter sediminis]
MSSVLQKFYDAFIEKDAEEMVDNYHPDIRFEDPAFGVLHGKDAADMWRMLCKNGKDLQVTYDIIQEDEHKGIVQWEAKYTFSRTGRQVHNKVLAKFRIRNGLIINHEDSFNLKVWAKQAMGFMGLLFGGTAFFKEKLRKNTHRLLRSFQQKSLKS